MEDVELKYSWSAPVDSLEARKETLGYLMYGVPRITVPKWDDDDDSSVDEELLNEYLERLDADKKKVKKGYVDLSLRHVRSYHSLPLSKKLDWLTLQFIFRRYDPYCVDWKPQRLPLSGVSASFQWAVTFVDLCESDTTESDLKYDSDYENDSDKVDSDHEDCILDLNSLILEDSDVALT